MDSPPGSLSGEMIVILLLLGSLAGSISLAAGLSVGAGGRVGIS